MTDLPYLRSMSSPQRLSWRPSWLAALYLGVAAGAGTSLAIALCGGGTSTVEWHLVLLLRFMAIVKATMVLAAVGLTHWRLGRPIRTGVAAGYVVSITLMLVAPGLIWSLAHVALGAGFFHAGLLTFLVLAWRDDATDRLVSRRGDADDIRT